MKSNQSQNGKLNDWKEVKLSFIGSFSKGAGITKEQLVEVGCNAVRYGELYTKFDFQIKKIYSFIPRSVIPETKKIKYGDIVFAGSGETIDEIGKSAAYLLQEDAYAGGDTIIFTPTNANSLFLSYFLNIGEARKKLRELGQGQSVVHIYKSDIENLKLHLPPLPEQNRIVAVLETWDKAIELLSKKIEIKKQIKKGLMQGLLTGKKRLKGFNGKWKLVSAGEIFESTTKKNFPNEEILSATQTIGVVPRSMLPGRVTMPEGSRSSFKLVDVGDFVISLRSFQGGIEYSRFKGIVSPAYTVLKEIKKINKDFYKYLFKTQNFINRLSIAVIGIRDGKQINYDEFCNVLIPDLSLEEQTSIANILTLADNEIDLLEKKLSVLKNQKKYLLNNLITGSIRTLEDLLERVG